MLQPNPLRSAIVARPTRAPGGRTTAAPGPACLGLLIRVSKESRRVPAADYSTTRRGVMTEITQERRAPADGQKEQSATEQAIRRCRRPAAKFANRRAKRRRSFGHRRERESAASSMIAPRRPARRQRRLRMRSVGSASSCARRAGPEPRSTPSGLPSLSSGWGGASDADGHRLLRDAEQFARRRPWVAVMGGATLGFLVARFIEGVQHW